MEEIAETPKTRKPRSDKGKSRKPVLVVRKEIAQESPIVAIVDGEIIRCEAWGIENGFLKLRYWPEQRGRIGTRMISLSSIKDFQIEEPQGMAPMAQPMAPMPQQVMPLYNVPAQVMYPNTTGPVQELNPLIAMRNGGMDPKAARSVPLADPMGLRPMSRISFTDKEGNKREEVIEAGMQ